MVVALCCHLSSVIARGCDLLVAMNVIVVCCDSMWVVVLRVVVWCATSCELLLFGIVVRCVCIVVIPQEPQKIVGAPQTHATTPDVNPRKG